MFCVNLATVTRPWRSLVLPSGSGVSDWVGAAGTREFGGPALSSRLTKGGGAREGVMKVSRN
jgi:hypothetical protein